ncbi:hypothetical protein DFJ73DRAFT_819964 [Zopfochytrium polystomum]|nr:hypothetical protein DFJ73DRAFT_819964 [Zopfochytrium polystomum]
MGLTFSRASPFIDDRDAAQLSFVITGCDTGFGHATALLLVAKGATVFAGCLTQNGIDGLNSKVAADPKKYRGTLRTGLLDVTSDESVAKFCDRVKAEVPSGIFALLNNAGLGGGGAMELTSLARHKLIMEVNYFGGLRMMQALLPSLRSYIRNHSNNGQPTLAPRVVNIASVAGRTMTPSMSSYTASKHAFKALTETVRMEVRDFGIKVVLIEPYFAVTPMVNAATIEGHARKEYEAAPAEAKEAYGDSSVTGAGRFITDTVNSPLVMTPDYVVGFIAKALLLKRPPHRFLVGLMAWVIVFLRACVPTWILDTVLLRLSGSPSRLLAGAAKK